MMNNAELAKHFATMINVEADAKNMLYKTAEEVEKALDDKKAFVQFVGVRPVSYIGYTEWRGSYEVGPLIIDPDYRHQGYGLEATNAIIQKLQAEGEGKKRIIALTNARSSGIFKKIPCFKEEPLITIEDDVRDACSECLECDSFPNCHCHYFVYDGDAQT